MVTFAFRMNFKNRTATIFLLILMTSTWARGNVTICGSSCLARFYQCITTCSSPEHCTQCVDYQKACLKKCSETNGSRKRREIYIAPAKITDVQGLKRYLNL